MKDPLIMKYSIGLGVFFLILLVYLVFSLIAKKHRWGRKGIIVHFLLGAVLCAAVLVFSQYLEMAIADFHLKILSPTIINYIQTFLIGLIVLNMLYFFVNRLEEIQISKGADRTSAKIITRVLKIAIFIGIVLLFGEHFGMSLSGLMTFGGIGGIALGFASKDVLSNFFSGIMLYFDRPFNIGDWINSPDRQIEGVVVEIGWRITKIMTFENRPLYIPNSLFSSISVENPGRMTNRRIKTELGLRYEDADKIGVIVTDIKTMLQNNPKIDTTQTMLVYFNDFADSSLNIMVYCFTKTVKWAEWLEAQQEVYLQMIEIVHQHGADFAFPSETVYMNNDTAPFTVTMPAMKSDERVVDKLAVTSATSATSATSMPQNS